MPNHLSNEIYTAANLNTSDQDSVAIIDKLTKPWQKETITSTIICNFWLCSFQQDFHSVWMVKIDGPNKRAIPVLAEARVVFGDPHNVWYYPRPYTRMLEKSNSI